MKFLLRSTHPAGKERKALPHSTCQGRTGRSGEGSNPPTPEVGGSTPPQILFTDSSSLHRFSQVFHPALKVLGKIWGGSKTGAGGGGGGSTPYNTLAAVDGKDATHLGARSHTLGRGCVWMGGPTLQMITSLREGVDSREQGMRRRWLRGECWGKWRWGGLNHAFPIFSNREVPWGQGL